MDGMKVFVGSEKPNPPRKAPRPSLVTAKDVSITIAIVVVLGVLLSGIIYYERRLSSQAARIDVLEKDLLSTMKVVKIVDAEQQETRAAARETERRFDKLVSALERLR